VSYFTVSEIVMRDGPGPLDKIEDKIQEREDPRPARSKIEKALDEIPNGPLNNLGGGTAAGVIGYYAISTGQLAVLPIPGIKQPGYGVISHGVKPKEEFERHTVRISAASKDIAEFVAKYEVSAPSNIDFFASETEVSSVDQIKKRPTFSTWEVVVDVADRGQKDE
jgi:hypothetical protein